LRPIVTNAAAIESQANLASRREIPGIRRPY
jgi:hypothetical protein